MSSSTERFTSRVENYAKYRPTYPPEVVELLRSECGLTAEAVVADVGSGTGILTELLLKNGNDVIGVEPNEAMRKAGDKLLSAYPKFKSVAGSAEATTLAPGSLDLITAGQAFHWFDRPVARAEFARVLKPSGFVALIWNDRRLGTTPFLKSYEQFLRDFGTDYAKVQEFDPRNEIASFFAPGNFKVKDFYNRQEFDFAGLRGRVLSASYTPEPGHAKFDSMLKALEQIFISNQEKGMVAFEYDTKVFYGQLV
ncbi:MAG TPA: class I SAM-dependent methyltransferase [Pyrinomonadaceae bacterium]|nr:class I SAM-dependent methyltransferase [Pyrinomonadaceae bacterium]